jgi:hypothetical protein
MIKVVMLGIGGLDADLLRVYGPSLPDLRRLLLHSPFLEMRSCFPPEPLPAWASIYTGLHPASHGLLTGGDPPFEHPATGDHRRRPPILARRRGDHCVCAGLACHAARTAPTGFSRGFRVGSPQHDRLASVVGSGLHRFRTGRAVFDLCWLGPGT